jgi:hypothetical protein
MGGDDDGSSMADDDDDLSSIANMSSVADSTTTDLDGDSTAADSPAPSALISVDDGVVQNPAVSSQSSGSSQMLSSSTPIKQRIHHHHQGSPRQLRPDSNQSEDRSYQPTTLVDTTSGAPPQPTVSSTAILAT